MSGERGVRVVWVVALATLAALLASARGGWLGPDVGRGSGFCEAARDGWIKQPANTWSNLAFVLAGLAVSAYAVRPERVGGFLRRHPAAVTVFAVVVVLLGPASMAMHATQSALGGRLDVLSMHLIAGLALAMAVTRLGRWGPGALVVVLVLAVGAAQVYAFHGARVAAFGSAGNAAFAGLLLLATVLEVVLIVRGRPRQDLRFGAAALGALLCSFAVWRAAVSGVITCIPDSLVQAHAFWHTGCAAAAYLLFRHYAAEHD